MKRFLYNHWVETAVVVALFFILLIVMVPKFNTAQVSSKVTQARLLLDAMSDYLIGLRMGPASMGSIQYEKATSFSLVVWQDTSRPYGSVIEARGKQGGIGHVRLRELFPDIVYLPLRTSVPDLTACRYQAVLGRTPEVTRLAKSAGVELRPDSVSAYVIGPYADHLLYNIREAPESPPYGYTLYDPSNGLLSHGWLYRHRYAPPDMALPRKP